MNKSAPTSRGSRARLDLDGVILEVPNRPEVMSAEAVHRWYDLLIGQKQQVEAALATSTADAKTYQQKCFTRGRSGKEDWFSYEADEAVWRAKVRTYLNAVEQNLRQAKAVLREIQAPPAVDPSKPKLKVHKGQAAGVVVDAAVVWTQTNGSPEATAVLRSAVAAFLSTQDATPTQEDHTF